MSMILDSEFLHKVELQKLQDQNEKNYWKNTGKKMLKHWRLYMLFLPLFLTLLLWRYFPIYGLLNAFKVNATNIPGVFDKPYGGFSHFKTIMFGDQSTQFWIAFRNTFVLSLYGLMFGFPVPIILALFFNEIKSDILRSGFQILAYLPRFISTVIITSILAMLLKGASGPGGAISPGVLAVFLQKIGLVSAEKSANGLLFYASFFRPIFVTSGIWESAGYGSIVFFAAAVAIPKSRFEAAQIDGANKFAQIRYVMLPGIASTIIIMLILQVGNLLNVGYEKVYLLQVQKTGMITYAETNVIATFVIRLSGMSGEGGSNSNQSMASAADLIAAIMSMVLVLGANFVAKRITKVSVY